MFDKEEVMASEGVLPANIFAHTFYPYVHPLYFKPYQKKRKRIRPVGVYGTRGLSHKPPPKKVPHIHINVSPKYPKT